jgi:hypothetical protein
MDLKLVITLLSIFIFFSILADVTIVAVAMIIIAITVMIGNSGTVGDGAGELEEVGVGVLDEPEVTAVTELAKS